MFLAYGQVRVGINGGLETAIHLSRLVLDKYQTDPQMCLLKFGFYNAFNLCNNYRELQCAMKCEFSKQFWKR